jgi:hypothetical protein
MSSSYDSSSDDEWDLSEEEDIMMILALHTNKRPKHGGSISGYLMLRMERIEGHNKCMRILHGGSLFSQKGFSVLF